MKNYVNDIKSIVNRFYTKKRELLEKKEQNFEQYSIVRAEELNGNIDEQINVLSVKAMDQVIEHFNKAKRVLGYLDLMDGKQLADPDRLLLSDPIMRPSITDVRGLYQRHTHDFTFLKILKKWCEAQDDAGFTELAIMIRTPYDYLFDIQEYTRTAVAKINYLSNKFFTLKQNQSETMALTMDSFMGNYFNQPLVDRITEADIDIEKIYKSLSPDIFTAFDSIDLNLDNVEKSRNLRDAAPILNGQTV